MKKYILILIILVLIGSLACYFFLHKEESIIANNETDNKIISNSVVVPQFQIEFYLKSNCFNENDDNCERKKSTYYTITDFTNHPGLKNEIQRINTLSYDYYVNTSEYQKRISECPEKSTIYKYRYSESAMIYYYADDNYAVIAYSLYSTDVCTEKVTNPLYFVYYYDVQKNKMKDENWLIEALKLKREDLNQKLIASLISQNFISTKKEYSTLLADGKMSCQLYLNSLGSLVSQCFKTDDYSYASATLKTSKELGLNNALESQ